jgi:O-antigen polymerase
MTRFLNRAKFYVHLAIITLLFATSFIIEWSFFNGLTEGKQLGVELMALPIIIFLVVVMPFTRQIRFSAIDGGVILFTAWYFIRELLSSTPAFHSIEKSAFHLLLWLTIYLFVRMGASNSRYVWGVVALWLGVVFIQSCFGLMQLYGLSESYHGLYRITGAFHNPGPFSGFVVSALPLALGCYFECQRYLKLKSIIPAGIIDSPSDVKGAFFKDFTIPGLNIKISVNTFLIYLIGALSIGTMAAILLVVPAAQSRAAWVAGLAGSVYVLWGHQIVKDARYKISAHLKKLSLPLRTLLLFAMLTIVVSAAGALYLMKQGSANGRLLMWQVSAQIIKERPITGHGAGAFEALYMTQQAKWFASDKGTPAQAMVAGSPDAPFNELLKLWLEKGAVAILLGFVILWLIFGSQQPKKLANLRTYNSTTTSYHEKTRGELSVTPLLVNGIKGALLATLTFSLFSYPFNISPFVLQVVVAVALLAATTQKIALIKRPGSFIATITLGLLLMMATFYFVPQRKNHYAALKTWQVADQLYAGQLYHEAIEAYSDLFPTLIANGLYLQMYGKALSMDKQHQKSNEILALAEKQISNQVIYNTLGDNHKALGNYPQAEAAYKKSAQMIPSLMFPKYLLAKLYVESGEKQKAIQLAGEILNSPVKVESSATREIMADMRAIVNEQ